MKTIDSVSGLPAVSGRSPVKITRRFAVASLLVIAVAILFGAPASASAGSVKLYPPTAGPFPNASGTYAVSSSSIYPPGPAYYINSLSVSKLAPNTPYYIQVYLAQWSVDQHGYPVFKGWMLRNWYFQTDAQGAYKSGVSKGGFGAIGYGAIFYGVKVHDSSTGTLVLTD